MRALADAATWLVADVRPSLRDWETMPAVVRQAWLLIKQWQAEDEQRAMRAARRSHREEGMAKRQSYGGKTS
jgi:hypothetical protein